MLNRNPALKFIEYYLLLVSVVHVVIGTYLSIKKGKISLNKGFFMFTGFVVLAFIVTHLQTFKFGPDYRIKVPGVADEVRDLFRLEEEVFSNLNIVAWYVFATSVLGWHLWRGWEKAVFNLDFVKDNKENREAGKAVGHFLIWPLTLGFISTPVWFYYRSTVSSA